MEQPLDAPTLRVLQVVRERATDGFVVMKRAGVKPGELSDALRELDSRGVVSIKGDIAPEQVGEAYISVPPGSIAYADYLLGRRRFTSMR